MRIVKPLVICSVLAIPAVWAFSAPLTESSGAKAAVMALRLKPVAGAEQSGGYHQIRKKKRRSRRSKRKRKSRSSGTAATARTSTKKKASANPFLFGTTEKRSSNFKPFKKWKGAMNRMAAEQADLAVFRKKFRKWVVFLDLIKNEPKFDQIKAVNNFMNKSRYIQDKKNWGKKDYWAAPGEFLAKFGDCEDYAIAKYMALKYLGFDTNKMRIAAVKDMNLKVGHAILAVYFQNRIVILDNQIKVVADSRKIRHYNPVYSINEHNWWRHRAAKG